MNKFKIALIALLWSSIGFATDIFANNKQEIFGEKAGCMMCHSRPPLPPPPEPESKINAAD